MNGTDETVQSTSMLKKMSVALLGSACTLVVGIDPASAIDTANPSEPSVIYSREQAPQPVRVASNERSGMGGGFIEFLFGDAPQGRSYQQPMYQQQPGYYDPRQLPPMGQPQMQGARQDEALDPRQRPFDPKF